MEGVDYIDAEGADAVREIAQAGLDHGIDLHLARVEASVLDVLERDHVIDLIGAGHVHDNIAAAVQSYRDAHPAPDTSA